MSKHISTKTKWVKLDGWRGYSEPINAVGGCNHTGDWDDSPCPTRVVKSELEGFKKILKQNKIRYKQFVTQTSNLFCQSVYILVHPEQKEQGLELAKDYSKMVGIRLFYPC